jgi:hypothetical protein
MPGELNSERQEANAGHRNDRRAQMPARTSKHAIDQETRAPYEAASPRPAMTRRLGPGCENSRICNYFFSRLIGNK